MTSVASHPKRRVRVVHLKTVGRIIYKTDDIMSLLVLSARCSHGQCVHTAAARESLHPFQRGAGLTEREDGRSVTGEGDVL